MDWYFEGHVEAASELRRQIGEYLRRHAADASASDDAELVVAELLSNAVRHALGPVWVSLTWSGPRPVLTVTDMGAGFELDHPPRDATPWAESGRGLRMVSKLAPRLDAAARASGGSRVSAELPVLRQETKSYDPPRNRTGVLPELDEAAPDGTFGREPFLRALVVQLAQTLEDQEGPAAAEAAVAQVGTDVGGQMELAYRAATGVEGRLSAEQAADCCVRLKDGIGGSFSAVEVTDNRIVFVNHDCPFGDVVQHAPALCRMTSSVFGGIAARNSEREASVFLEERIALGDPQCRVVVSIDAQPENPGLVHRYQKPQTPPS